MISIAILSRLLEGTRRREKVRFSYFNQPRAPNSVTRLFRKKGVNHFCITLDNLQSTLLNCSPIRIIGDGMRRMEEVQNGAAFKAIGRWKTNSMHVDDDQIGDNDDDGGGDEDNDQGRMRIM